MQARLAARLTIRNRQHNSQSRGNSSIRIIVLPEDSEGGSHVIDRSRGSAANNWHSHVRDVLLEANSNLSRIYRGDHLLLRHLLHRQHN
jgi:hypothetical protein